MPRKKKLPTPPKTPPVTFTIKNDPVPDGGISAKIVEAYRKQLEDQIRYGGVPAPRFDDFQKRLDDAESTIRGRLSPRMKVRQSRQEWESAVGDLLRMLDFHDAHLDRVCPTWRYYYDTYGYTTLTALELIGAYLPALQEEKRRIPF